MARLRVALTSAAALACLAATPVLSADLVVPGVGVPEVGVACEDPVVQAFPSVWLGHFTGGYSHYLGEGGAIVLDWRDEKLCFPSNGSCSRYIKEMRRDFHRPEGYFTCLPIR